MMRARLSLALRASVAAGCLIGLDPAWATPGQDTVLFGRPGWVLPGASADMNFATGQYFGLSPGQLTVSRASTEYEVCNGQLYGPFANNALAITPGCGAWVWEARTNLIGNNTMVGAVAGTPGTLPTNWSIGTAGLSQQVVGTGGLPNGFNYIDVRFFGTTTGQYGSLNFMPASTVGGSYGKTYSMYAQLAVVAGTFNNVFQYGLAYDELNSGGSYITGQTLPFTITSSLFPYSGSRTTINSGTVYLQPKFYFNMTGASGQAVDFTLRIALPQLELNPNIPATVASAVKAADGTGGVNGAGVYTITGGTCTTQPTLNVTWAGGVLTVNSVANAGSCTALPPSPATLAYLSGAATGWTGATATLTPVDNSAQGFATGPILTSSGAVTRAATTANSPALAAIVAGKSGTIMADAQIFAPVGNSTPMIFQADDGTFNNRREAFPNVGNMVQVIFNNVGSGSTSQNFSNGGGSFSTASRRSVVTWTPSTQSATFDGSTPVSSASAPAAVGISQFYIGSSNLSSAPLNGLIKENAIWPYAVANPQQLSTAGYR